MKSDNYYIETFHMEPDHWTYGTVYHTGQPMTLDATDKHDIAVVEIDRGSNKNRLLQEADNALASAGSLLLVLAVDDGKWNESLNIEGYTAEYANHFKRNGTLQESVDKKEAYNHVLDKGPGVLVARLSKK